MRVTPEKQEETRRRLLEAGARLFAERGFGATTTRDIAKSAMLASGTMFNYFRTKEELALALVLEAVRQAHAEFVATRRLAGTLDEWLFALVATELRRLAPMRTYLKEILNAVMQPLPDAESHGLTLRRLHLEQVQEVLGHFGIDAAKGVPGWDTLYWSLYLGVLGFWSADTTSNQEASMALLDRATGMFLSLVRYWPGSG